MNMDWFLKIVPPGIQANAVLNELRCANNNREQVEMERGSLRQLAYISMQSKAGGAVAFFNFLFFLDLSL